MISANPKFAGPENHKDFLISQDKWFYFASERKASSIEELKEVLKSVDEAEFTHHVNNERNDFANWVEGVFKEKRLAKRMRGISDREGMITILEDFLKKKKEKKESYQKIKRLIIPEEKKIISEPVKEESEKELSEKEIKGIVDEAKQVFEKEVTEEEKHKAEGAKHHKLELSRFIVKEFVYGFILGLIFGLIMLGIIFNIT